MKARFTLLPLAVLATPGGPAYSTAYMSVAQAQAVMFPGATFQLESRTLTGEQVKAIEHASGVPVRNHQLKAWRVSSGGWFVVDEVVGKHEFIPFAVAFDKDGVINAIEILEYREAYGGQIRDPAWLRQFYGKHLGAKLRLEREIRNISGATLSCKHITDGISRLLATYEVALAPSTH